MVHYLCRYGILRASIEHRGRRGARRQFSYTDVVYARSVGKLLLAGASVATLRRALSTLRRKLNDVPVSNLVGKHVVIVGQSVYLSTSDRSIVDLTADGQLAFHFVLDVPADLADEPDRLKTKRVKRA
jgi:hypothetical protein